jgi:mannosyl-3-phosphoglycerate phosphatase family protein
MRTVIFSDLDGSLLDQDTYAYDAALPALRMARDKGIPVVIVSSKTMAEIEVWRQRLNNHDPFVVENGGGIYIPKGYFPFVIPGALEQVGYLMLSLGIPYATIRKKFAELRERTGINVRGFGDMTTEEVADLTGLTRQEAAQAKKRDFTEPFVFPESADAQFLQLVEGERLRWTQGAFFHLMGDHHKGRAVDRLRSWYERKYQAPVTAIGIGDSLNDLPFLLAVDRPVLIRKKNGTYEGRIEIPGLVRTRQAGSAGWGEAVEELLKR